MKRILLFAILIAGSFLSNVFCVGSSSEVSPISPNYEDEWELVENLDQSVKTEVYQDEDLSSYSDYIKEFLAKYEQGFINLTSYKSEDKSLKILRGCLVHHCLVNDSKRFIELIEEKGSLLYQEAIYSLVWFYYAIAGYQDELFIEGTFDIKDTPNFAIFNFLKEAPGAKKRISSHYKASDEIQNRQTERQHYGLDMPQGVLPAGKGTLLFGISFSNENRIFIKPENHGVENIIDLIAHAGEYLQSVGRKVAPNFFGSDDAPEYRKDRVPKEVLSHYNEILEELFKQNEITSSEEVNKCKKIAKGFGIRSMWQSARVFREQLSQRSEESENLIMKISEFINNLEKDYTNLEFRVGREVMITPQVINGLSTDQDIEVFSNNFYPGL